MKINFFKYLYKEDRPICFKNMISDCLKEMYSFKYYYIISAVLMSIISNLIGKEIDWNVPVTIINITLENLPIHIVFIVTYFTSLFIYQFIFVYVRNAISFGKWDYHEGNESNPFYSFDPDRNQTSWANEGKIRKFTGLNLNEKYHLDKMRDDNINILLK